MPSIGISRDEPRRPDIVIGDRYGTSCAWLLPDMVEETMRAMGYSVGRNKPYAGGFITEHYGNPAGGVHTIQIELNRAAYMNERSRERSCQASRRSSPISERWPIRSRPSRLAISVRLRPRRSRQSQPHDLKVRIASRDGTKRLTRNQRRQRPKKKGRSKEQAAQV